MFKVLAVDNEKNPYSDTGHQLNINIFIGRALYMNIEEAKSRIPGYIEDLKEICGYGDHILNDLDFVVEKASDTEIDCFYS
jgi:hypothetical protein